MFFYTRQNVLQNLFRIFGTRIIGCYYTIITQFCCHFTHQRTFCTITVTAASKDCNHTAFCKRLRCRNYIFQAIRCVRIVYNYAVVICTAYSLKTACNAAYLFQCMNYFFNREAQRFTGSQSRQGVIYIKVTS